MEQYKLNPYREMPLMDEKLEAWITAVEKALGYKLFFWQKTYIEKGAFRQYGETTAKILRELSQTELLPIDFRQYRRHGRREHIYCEQLLETKAILDNAGIQTRAVITCEKEYREYLRRQQAAEITKATGIPKSLFRI